MSKNKSIRLQVIEAYVADSNASASVYSPLRYDADTDKLSISHKGREMRASVTLEDIDFTLRSCLRNPELVPLWEASANAGVTALKQFVYGKFLELYEAGVEV